MATCGGFEARLVALSDSRAIADELVVALHVADVARVTDRHASDSAPKK